MESYHVNPANFTEAGWNALQAVEGDVVEPGMLPKNCKIAWSKDKQGRLVARLVAPGGAVYGEWVQGQGVVRE